MKNFVLPFFLLVLTCTACHNSNKLTSDKMDTNLLEGNWELDYISGPRIAFNGLYPDKKPTMSFNVKDKRVNGNSGCNTFAGPFTMDKFFVDFNGPIVSTKMACPGEGETVFFNTLKKVTRFAVTDSTTLNLIMGDVAMMRFHKVANP